MPFGLNCAPYIFTKLMKPVISYLRNRGLVSVLYLDDFLLFGNTASLCKYNIDETVTFLEQLGLIINNKKSKFTPSNICTYLGFIYDSINMTISLPKEKKEKIYLVNIFLNVRQQRLEILHI